MGADIYIKKLKPPILGFELSDKAVELGYFRDAYNSRGLFSQLGISWWQLMAKYCISKGEDVLPFAKIDEFYNEVKIAKEKKGKLDSWTEDHWRLFVKFIALAKSYKSDLECSV